MEKSEFVRLTRDISFEDRLRYSNLTRAQACALSPKEKIRYFYSLHVGHAKLKLVVKKIKRCLSPFVEHRIITLIGATGAGKTSFIEFFLTNEFKSEKPGQLPFLMITAPALGTTKISWSGVYRLILEAGEEPLIDQKRASFVEDGRLRTVPASTQGQLPSLQMAVVNMLRYRETDLLAMDEVLHLLRFGDPTKLMDTFKSLADAASCQLLLVGGFDLLEMVATYAQVARRERLIYFDRYQDKKTNEKGKLVKNDEDIVEFGDAILKLQARWPFDYTPNFFAAREDLIIATLGIFGLLKDFMMQCLIEQAENSGGWKDEFVERSLKRLYTIQAIQKEVDAGEAKLKKSGLRLYRRLRRYARKTR